MYQCTPSSPHDPPKYTPQPQIIPLATPVYVHQPPMMMMQSPAPVAYMYSPPLDDDPMLMICPACRIQVLTRTKPEIGTGTWISCLGLGAMTCCLCSCISFCFDIFKDISHSCPVCSYNFGTFKRM